MLFALFADRVIPPSLRCDAVATKGKRRENLIENRVGWQAPESERRKKIFQITDKAAIPANGGPFLPIQPFFPGLAQTQRRKKSFDLE